MLKWSIVRDYEFKKGLMEERIKELEARLKANAELTKRYREKAERLERTLKEINE